MAPKAVGKAKAKTGGSGAVEDRQQRDGSLSARIPDRSSAVAVAREVLRLAHVGDHGAVLRVLGDSIGSAPNAIGGGPAARKAFLKISMLIHPDKLQGFPEATKAFQALVHAFDRTQAGCSLTSVEPSKQKALARSNEGCFRTEVQCPRCKVKWGASCEGNPDYYYNFLMQGLRRFSCSTCLLSFGCFTAVHSCPHCRRAFDYSPDKYNQKVICGNPGCNKSFGFLMYHVSEGALKAARDQARAEFQKLSKDEESRNARAQRAARRTGGPEDPQAAFVFGLRDVCPRCGLELDSFEDGAQLHHLRNCNNANAHKMHSEREQQKETSRKAAAAKERAQLSAASEAVWTFSGGHVAEMHMLDEEQVRGRCKLEGLSTRGEHATLVGRLADYCSARGDAMGTPSQTVPRNLHTLSDAKLAVVCAAHRLRGLASREERIDALESLCESEGHAHKAVVGSKAKAKAVVGRAKNVDNRGRCAMRSFWKRQRCWLWGPCEKPWEQRH
eukprot:TRINITY_DN11373_c0_g1_i1.p1 TRINITY_DN11373_c0_g1~~TRINITY_DN11373_c0_g1_i1.p1  ORF type:complete len:500 (-),score=78.17 TRINITY_DN11373_c0_g1_i1:328-1827(-)